ncbi:MAG TPA: XrtA system polysaccharide deacetylase [Myxococcota bacterium]|nr:XrtA system polysaccharide deacetylase [Myxococcota bacterium]
MAFNALTVDLEEYFQVSNFEKLIDRNAWNALPSRVNEPTQRLLDLFDATESRATFFALGWIAERNPQLLRAIAERGHEIACHGYGHELVYAIGPERFRSDLKRARSAIEDATGRRVRGYRAPSYSITKASLWALPILVQEGFDFDSSIFPVRHPRYGIPDFARWPVKLDLGAGLSIREFPLTTLALGRFNLPLAGGAYLRFLPPALFRVGFSRLQAAGKPTVLYVHPWEIDPGQPRQAVSARVRVNHYHNLGATEGRLRGLLERFEFNSLGDVLDGLEAAGRLAPYRIPEGIAAAAA